MSANLDENKPRLIVDLTQMLAEVPSRLTRVESDINHMEKDIGELRGEVTELRTEVRADILGLRVELRWLIGIAVAGFGSIFGLILKNFH